MNHKKFNMPGDVPPPCCGKLKLAECMVTLTHVGRLLWLSLGEDDKKSQHQFARYLINLAATYQITLTTTKSH